MVLGASEGEPKVFVSSFYSNRVEKTLCKLPEQWNLLFREDSCTPLGQFCLFDALNAMRNRFPIVEHLCNLHQLPVAGLTFSAVPVEVKAMGSFPVRAFTRLGAAQWFPVFCWTAEAEWERLL